MILHCDLNSFYASVEELYHPEARGLPIAVGGNADQRHGIILAKTPAARKYGVTTGEALWQARLKCPDLMIYPPHYERYMLFSQRIRCIFHEYTDLVEPFGLDEAWLDVTASGIYGDGVQIADTLRKRIFNELGITASVGVSFNKIFAKLGSDLHKPDRTTVIARENFREIVWPLDCSELLYIGPATASKLTGKGISTIGELAQTPLTEIRGLLGKAGEMIWGFANGLDQSPVARYDTGYPVKSIGNSVTCYRDLANWQDLTLVMEVLGESVASRLREQGLVCREVTVWLRDDQLFCFSRQMPVETTDLARDIIRAALSLCRSHFHFEKPLRSIGVRASRLMGTADGRQISLFESEGEREKQLKLEMTVDDIRSRYGYYSIGRLSRLLDPALSSFDPRQEHVIHPESFLK